MQASVDLLRRERDVRRAYVAQLVVLGAGWLAVLPLLVLLPELTGTGLWGAVVLLYSGAGWLATRSLPRAAPVLETA